jgi:hypothetical protein
MQDGGTAFFNNTNDDGNFAGMVISKTFAVTYGATYAVVARGEGGDINPASISVYANGRGIIAFFSVKGIVSIGPALVVANATSLTIEFYNSVATGLGNDFALRNIRVWRTA